MPRKSTPVSSAALVGGSPSRRSAFGRLRSIGPRGVMLVAEAGFRLAAARALLATTPEARLAGRLGRFVSPAEARRIAEGRSLDDAQRRVAGQIGWAIAAAARRLPFDAVCLPQAIAARGMLKHRGIDCVIHFGAGGRDAPLSLLHAWLAVDGVEVTGYPLRADLVEVACLI